MSKVDDNKTNVVPLKNYDEPLLRDAPEAQRVAFESAAKALLKALQFKDDYTFGHSMRVGHYSRALAIELGLSSSEIYQTEMSGIFHDIGKLGVPEQVLQKPSRLTEEEFQIMKKHPEYSGDIVSELGMFKNIANDVRCHHERYDGRGYPNKLKGEDIPLNSRIILIADTFDAMTSSRPYRKGLPYKTAFEELNEFAGTQFDPTLVALFIKAMEKDQSKQEDQFYIEILNSTFKKNAA